MPPEKFNIWLRTLEALATTYNKKLPSYWACWKHYRERTAPEKVLGI
jgi:hypothetical protein